MAPLTTCKQQQIDAVEVKDPERYKTTLCKKWMATGTCPYGARCQFAHGEHELRARPAGKPLRPPNFWMRSKAKQAADIRRTTTPIPTSQPVLAPVPFSDANVPPGLAASDSTPRGRVRFDLPAPAAPAAPAASAAPAAAFPPAAAATTDSSLGGYGVKLLGFGPIDASGMATAECGDCLRVNQTTGKVEAAFAGGEATGYTASVECEEPPAVCKAPSYSTSLVRRAVSFLFDNEAPTLLRRNSSRKSIIDTIGDAKGEHAIIDKLGSMLDEFESDVSATPLPPPAAPRRLSHPRLPALTRVPTWGATGFARPVAVSAQ